MPLDSREILEDDFQPISSLDQLNHFISSSIWTDMKKYIDMRISLAYITLETVEPEKLVSIQKELEALRMMIDLPELLISMKEEKEEQNAGT